MPRSFHLFSYPKAKAFCGNLRDPHFFVIDKSCQKSEWNHLHTLHPASPPRLCVRYFFLSRNTEKGPPDLFVVCLATEKPLSNVPFVPLLRGFLHIYSLIPLFVLSEEFVIDAITKDK